MAPYVSSVPTAEEEEERRLFIIGEELLKLAANGDKEAAALVARMHVSRTDMPEPDEFDDEPAPVNRRLDS